MSMVSVEPGELRRIIRQRQQSGGDRYDEVWEGVYVMSPLADSKSGQAQREVARLSRWIRGVGWIE